ncbi:MAG: hypothetical protein AB2793_00160 [Candidatus Thiodiazotropha sp.]
MTAKNPTPVIECEDETRGLVLTFDKSVFCTKLLGKTDKKRTRKPYGLQQINENTAYIINKLDGCPVSEGLSHIVMLYGKKHLKPPKPSQMFTKWRHISHRVEAMYLNQSLVKRAADSNLKPYAFSVRLSPAFARHILNQGGAPFLLSRLRTYLRRELNRTADIWLIIEATIGDGTSSEKEYRQNRKSPINRHKGLLHFHGAISLGRGEKNIFKSVIRKLNSSINTTFNQSETNIKPMNFCSGWANYVTKHAHYNSAFLPGISRLSRTNGLINLAKTLYQADRDSYRGNFKRIET